MVNIKICTLLVPVFVIFPLYRRFELRWETIGSELKSDYTTLSYSRLQSFRLRESDLVRKLGENGFECVYRVSWGAAYINVLNTYTSSYKVIVEEHLHSSTHLTTAGSVKSSQLEIRQRREALIN